MVWLAYQEHIVDTVCMAGIPDNQELIVFIMEWNGMLITHKLLAYSVWLA